MKRGVELWIITSHDLIGLDKEWERSILEVLNSLIEYEAPLRNFAFEKENAQKKKDALKGFVTEGVFLLVMCNKTTQEVIGTVMIRPTKLESYQIGLLGFLHIQEAYQRKGYGKDLMMEAEKVSLKLGCQFVQLGVLANNQIAKDFYDEIGYQPTQVFLAKQL